MAAIRVQCPRKVRHPQSPPTFAVAPFFAHFASLEAISRKWPQDTKTQPTVVPSAISLAQQPKDFIDSHHGSNFADLKEFIWMNVSSSHIIQNGEAESQLSVNGVSRNTLWSSRCPRVIV